MLENYIIGAILLFQKNQRDCSVVPHVGKASPCAASAASAHKWPLFHEEQAMKVQKPTPACQKSEILAIPKYVTHKFILGII